MIVCVPLATLARTALPEKSVLAVRPSTATKALAMGELSKQLVTWVVTRAVSTTWFWHDQMGQPFERRPVCTSCCGGVQIGGRPHTLGGGVGEGVGVTPVPPTAKE